MHHFSLFARDHGRCVLCMLGLALALAAGLGWGGKAWLPMIPALYLLGRTWGSAAAPVAGDAAAYGVGAALAGFTPRDRG